MEGKLLRRRRRGVWTERWCGLNLWIRFSKGKKWGQEKTFKNEKRMMEKTTELKQNKTVQVQQYFSTAHKILEETTTGDSRYATSEACVTGVTCRVICNTISQKQRNRAFCHTTGRMLGRTRHDRTAEHKRRTIEGATSFCLSLLFLPCILCVSFLLSFCDTISSPLACFPSASRTYSPLMPRPPIFL